MVEFLNRYVSIAKEGSYGSSPGTAIFGEVDDESLETTLEMMSRNDISRQIAAKIQTGTEYSAGSLNLAMQVDDFLGMLIHSILPDDKATSGSPNSHQFEAASYGSNDRSSDSATSTTVFSTSTAYGIGEYVYYLGDLWRFTATHSAGAWDASDAYKIEYPSFTVVVGREDKQHTFTGMMVDKLSLSANIGEYVMLGVDFVGRAESDVGDLAVPNFDGVALNALHFANGNVFFSDGGDVSATASAKVKSISFDVSLNRDTDNSYGLGSSTYRTAPASQLMEVSGSVEFNEVVYTAVADEPTYQLMTAEGGLALLNKAHDGAPVMKLTFAEEDVAENILTIEFSHLQFEAPTGASVSGRDTNTMSVNFTALMNPLSGRSLSMTLAGANIQTAAY